MGKSFPWPAKNPDTSYETYVHKEVGKWWFLPFSWFQRKSCIDLPNHVLVLVWVLSWWFPEVILCWHSLFFPRVQAVLHRSFDRDRYHGHIMPEISSKWVDLISIEPSYSFYLETCLGCVDFFHGSLKFCSWYRLGVIRTSLVQTRFFFIIIGPIHVLSSVFRFPWIRR